MVTQARVGVWAHSLVASGLTRPSKNAPIGAAALRRLTARARRQTIFAFEPLILRGFARGQVTADPTWIDIFECCFKAQSSNVSFH